MSRLSHERWAALLARLNLIDDSVTFDQLAAAYSEPHRHYHNDEHVADCLAWLDRIDQPISRRDEIELALWFHDAVYAPRSATNEADSAAWAVQFLTAAGADDETVNRVQEMILATMHNRLPQTDTEQWIVDIDLSILGSDPAKYDRYESGTQEYAWVPDFLFRRKRKAVLRSFLDRPQIYATTYFQSHLETQARINMTRAITQLSVGR